MTDYLAAHLTKNVTLSDLAAVAELSPAHFCRAFKQATGRSPVRELIARRLEHAKALLSDPRLPVTEVAASGSLDDAGSLDGSPLSSWRCRAEPDP